MKENVNKQLDFFLDTYMYLMDAAYIKRPFFWIFCQGKVTKSNRDFFSNKNGEKISSSCTVSSCVSNEKRK